MGQLTAEQRVFVVKNWFVTKSLEQVRQLFGERLPDREPPTRMAIWKNVKNTLIMGQILIVILDILGARKLVDRKKILIGYTNYLSIIQEELAVVEMV